MITRVGTRLALTIVVLATIGCDRATKHVASVMLAGTPSRSLLADTVRLVYTENTGGFLSLGANLPPALRTGVFTIVTAVLLLGMVVFAVRARWSGWRVVALALFAVGGARRRAVRARLLAAAARSRGRRLEPARRRQAHGVLARHVRGRRRAARAHRSGEDQLRDLGQRRSGAARARDSSVLLRARGAAHASGLVLRLGGRAALRRGARRAAPRVAARRARAPRRGGLTSVRSRPRCRLPTAARPAQEIFGLSEPWSARGRVKDSLRAFIFRGQRVSFPIAHPANPPRYADDR